ncbi:hypothetical protein ACP275_11G043400 [Erythranthe tilingii]
MSSSMLSFLSRKGAAAGVSKWISRRGCCLRSPISNLSVSGESLRSPSSSPSKISPWLMLPPAVDAGGGDVVHKFFSLSENRVLSLAGEKKFDFSVEDYKLVGSSHGWLAVLDRRSNDLFLTNPLSRRRVNLPPLRKLDIPEPYWSGFVGCVSKVIISCSPDEEDCRAVMIFSPSDALAFCCPGLTTTTTEWIPIGTPHYSCRGMNSPRRYKSFVYSAAQKLLLCLVDAADHEFEAWDLRDPHSPNLIPMKGSVDRQRYPADPDPILDEETIKDMCIQTYSLVVNEKSGQLFVVKRFVSVYVDSDGCFVNPHHCYISPEEGWDDSKPHKTIDFDVFKYDADSGSLRYMDRSLDGLALFIGRM